MEIMLFVLFVLFFVIIPLDLVDGMFGCGE